MSVTSATSATQMRSNGNAADSEPGSGDTTPTTHASSRRPKTKMSIKPAPPEMTVFKNSEYSKITTKLSLPHLKHLCCAYGLKKTGTKPVLVERAYSHCSRHCAAAVVQRVMRGHTRRSYVHDFVTNSTYRDAPVNDTDFYTMDDFVDVPHYQIFRFRDSVDHMVYQFNAASFFQLLKTAVPDINININSCCDDNNNNAPLTANFTNPYTRSPISRNAVVLFFKKLSMSRNMQYPVCTAFKEEALTAQQAVELRTVELFQDINALGNYADSNWFYGLYHPQHIRFIQELYDIWTYRAELSAQIKCQVCPPHGLLFANPNSLAVMNDIRTASYETVRDINLTVIERLVLSGINDDDRKLGAFYVLSALTLVSPGARNALPWLYHSVAPAPSPVAYQHLEPPHSMQIPQQPPQTNNINNNTNNNANLVVVGNDLLNSINMNMHLSGLSANEINDVIYNILTYATYE